MVHDERMATPHSMTQTVPTPARGKLRTFTLEVQGMSCASCVNRAESALRAVAGVHDASVNLALERAQVHTDSAVLPQTMLDALATAGYRARLAGNTTPGDVEQGTPSTDGESNDRRWLIFAGLLSTPLLLQMISMSLALGWHLAPFAELALAAPVQLLAGARF